MEDAPPLLEAGTSPNNTLVQQQDDINYYESYSDSYDSENAIPIEPTPSKSPHRPMRARRTPAPPQKKQEDQNPRYKFKARSNPFRMKNLEENDSIMTKTQLKNMINLAIQEKPINLKSEEEYEYLKNQITKKRTYYASIHNYPEAIKYQKALEFVSNSEFHLLKYEAHAILSQEVKEKENNFKSSLENFDNETKNLIKELKDNIEKERNELIKKHNQQLDEFEAKWNSPEKNRLYNRPSNVLATLRRQLNFMLTQCRFEEAQELQKHIDERENFEKEENRLRMEFDFNEAYKKLTTKQNAEMNFFEEKSDLRLVTREQERQRLRVGFENREKKIRSQKNTASNLEKAWHATQNRRLEDGAILKKVTPSQAAITRIARKEIFEKEVITLSLPTLTVHSIAQKSSGKNKKTMKALKVSREKK